jgi:hypothetical protein
VRAGDAAAVRGGLLGAGAALLSLIPALLAARRRGRRGAETEAAGLLPQPLQDRNAGHRSAAWAHLALWLLAAVVPMSQLALGAEEQRSQGASARKAAAVTTDIAASNARTQFAAQARQTARELGVRAEGRRMGAAGATAAEAAREHAVADAEDDAAAAVEKIAIEMARPPVASDRLDPRMTAAVASEPPDWAAALAAEQAEADCSNRWGGWSNDAVMLIALVAAVLYVVELHREGGEERPPPPAVTDDALTTGTESRDSHAGLAFVTGVVLTAALMIALRRPRRPRS